MQRWIGLAWLWLLCVACGDDGHQSPSDAAPDSPSCVSAVTVAAVDPVTIWNGAGFPISVYGSGLASATSPAMVASDGTRFELTGVTVVDDTHLDAIVPAGAPPGAYALSLADQTGCVATGTLSVVDTSAAISVCGVDRAFGMHTTDTDVVITATADGTATAATCGAATTRFTSTPRAWLSVNTQLYALRDVAFVSAGTLAATVPGSVPVGQYTVLIQNPDGSFGMSTATFRVVDLPAPTVTGVSPPTIPVNFSSGLTITGQNFRSSATVELISSTGSRVALTVATASATQIDVGPPDLSLGVGTYTIRVTNGDEATYGDFQGLAVINASFNITTWTDLTGGALLPTAVMRMGTAWAQTSPAHRFLYAIGGDTGTSTPTRRNSTQVAVLDATGAIAQWFTARNVLPAGRTSLQTVAVGQYIYAVGGETTAGATTSVMRSKILLPENAPQITSAHAGLGGTLGHGAWYYRVSAVLAGTDLDNPGGETLPSHETVVHAVAGASVTLAWAAVPNAASYRIYRSAVVDGTSGNEVLLADGVAALTFVDTGSNTAGTVRPLREGEYGVWTATSSLNQARRSHGLAVAHDPAGNAFLYAIGGDHGATAADILADYEYASLSSDGATLGVWTTGTAMGSARTRLQSPVGEHATSSSVAAGTAYVYAVGGWSGTALVESYQPGTVQTGGALSWGTTVAANNILQALTAAISSNQMFVLGGQDAASAPQRIAKTNIYATPPSFGSLNTNSAAATDTTTLQTIAASAGLVHPPGRFFLIGGTTDGTTALARVWTNVY